MKPDSYMPTYERTEWARTKPINPKAFDFETFQMLEANLAEVLKWANQALEAVR